METTQQKQLQYYRHKAAECARKALACGEPSIRRGFAEAARRWRVLAQKHEASTEAEPISILALRR